MNTNELFLSEFMKRVDMRLFTPSLYRFFTDYLKTEKVRKYNGQFVFNTFIPPFPGPAFERFLSTFFGNQERSAVQSVDLALTNACMFNCWHCYNAGRLLADIPTETMRKIVRQLQELGAMVINFTGGEPCLRHDLPEICAALNEDSCGILATTGYGFTEEVARKLRDTGVYSISFSLDSAEESEHDRMRGVKGAFRIALKGIETALKWGFYTYTCAVPTKKLLQEENFRRLVELNEKLGVYELQLIEPAPAGKLMASHLDFGEKEFRKIIQYMQEYNQREKGVAISSFANMESPEFFGCGAGQSHIYIDGSGEVSPCNMIPISYGNAAREDLAEIIARMQKDFSRPFQFCLAHQLQDFFSRLPGKKRPASATETPPLPLPQEEDLPRFYQLLVEKEREVASEEEIVRGYNEASISYEDYWLTVAAAPIDELFRKLNIAFGARALDCGCGTGYSTVKLAQKVGPEGRVIGIDLSPGMIEKAKERTNRLSLSNIEFRVANVLEELSKIPPNFVDIAVLTWLIGYVGCQEIFPLLRQVLKPGGVVGFVAHLDRSPRVPIEVFEEIVREEPASMMKAVQLKFPKDADETRTHLQAAGFTIRWLKQDTFDFRCHTGEEVYDHLMKSGAGTTFYYSLKPDVREHLTREFIRRIDKRYQNSPQITIVHEYVVGIGILST